VTGISNIDRAVALMRQQLRRATNGPAAGPTSADRMTGAASPHRLHRLGRLAQLGDLAPKTRRRLFVRQLLADALGETLASDLSFQATANRVSDLFDSDAQLSQMLDAAIAQALAAK
jgi:hypothetical protein